MQLRPSELRDIHKQLIGDLASKMRFVGFTFVALAVLMGAAVVVPLFVESPRVVSAGNPKFETIRHWNLGF